MGIRFSNDEVESISYNDSTLDGSNIELSFADLQVKNAEPGVNGRTASAYETVNIAVGERSVDLFLDPNHFPIPVEDTLVNVRMQYSGESTVMNVESVEQHHISEYETLEYYSVEVTDCTEYQQMVAFLYLIGVLLQ